MAADIKAPARETKNALIRTPAKVIIAVRINLNHRGICYQSNFANTIAFPVIGLKIVNILAAVWIAE